MSLYRFTWISALCAAVILGCGAALDFDDFDTSRARAPSLDSEGGIGAVSEAPFSFSIEPDRITATLFASARARIRIERANGFNATSSYTLREPPLGISMAPIRVEGASDGGEIIINATRDAPLEREIALHVHGTSQGGQQLERDLRLTLMPSGALDSSFGQNGVLEFAAFGIRAAALARPDEDFIYVVGTGNETTAPCTQKAALISRIDTRNGSLDAAFGTKTGPSGCPRDIIVGKNTLWILAEIAPSGADRFELWRLDRNGQLIGGGKVKTGLYPVMMPVRPNEHDEPPWITVHDAGALYLSRFNIDMTGARTTHQLLMANALPTVSYGVGSDPDVERPHSSLFSASPGDGATGYSLLILGVQKNGNQVSHRLIRLPVATTTTTPTPTTLTPDIDSPLAFDADTSPLGLSLLADGNAIVSTLVGSPPDGFLRRILTTPTATPSFDSAVGGVKTLYPTARIAFGRQPADPRMVYVSAFNHIDRMTGAGVLDPTFSVDAPTAARAQDWSVALAVQVDGKVIHTRRREVLRYWP